MVVVLVLLGVVIAFKYSPLKMNAKKEFFQQKKKKKIFHHSKERNLSKDFVHVGPEEVESWLLRKVPTLETKSGIKVNNIEAAEKIRTTKVSSKTRTEARVRWTVTATTLVFSNMTCNKGKRGHDDGIA
ncbi:hypothetical protein YC2023_084314 [Brassica napus]